MENLPGLRRRKVDLLSTLSRVLGDPPGRLEELSAILGASPVDLKRIAAVIRGDSELNARLVRLASGALFCEGHRVHRLEDVLILLGAEELRDLAFACFLVDASRKSLGSHAQSFWSHAVLVALLAGRAAHDLRFVSAEEAYIGGLLHDAGKLPLLMAAEAERPSTSAWMGCDDGKTLVLEREYFGLDHTEAGRRLGLQWKLAPAIVEAMTWHHEPRRARLATETVGIIAIVNRCCASRQAADASLSEDFVRVCLPHIGKAGRIALLAILRREYPCARELAKTLSPAGQIDALRPCTLAAPEDAGEMSGL